MFPVHTYIYIYKNLIWIMCHVFFFKFGRTHLWDSALLTLSTSMTMSRRPLTCLQLFSIDCLKKFDKKHLSCVFLKIWRTLLCERPGWRYRRQWAFLGGLWHNLKNSQLDKACAMCHFENVSYPLVGLGLVDVVDVDEHDFQAFDISETILNRFLFINWIQKYG